MVTGRGRAFLFLLERGSQVFQEQQAVEAFHRKHSFPIGEPVKTRCPDHMDHAQVVLQDLSADCLTLAQAHNSPNDADLALVRLHLILEETAELAAAMVDGNKILAADALADLLYVVIGAGVSFDLPCQQLFWEVQQSNMTKAVRDPDDTRLRDKGPNFRPPNIATVLADYKRFKNSQARRRPVKDDPRA